MRGEVEYYDSYLRGEAYGFELYKDGELEDCCWGFIGSNEEALKGIEDYLPDACSGMTGELVERDSPRSMLKMFLDHARVQVRRRPKTLKRRPGSKPSKRRPGDFYLLYIMRKEDVIAGRT